MLDRHDLYAAPDDTLESWCLLAIDYANTDECTQWSVGFANPKQLIRTETQSLSTAGDETELLRELIENHLQPSRKEDRRTTLITFSGGELRRLRTRLLDQDIDASFRGFFHFNIETLIDQYFAESYSPEDSEKNGEAHSFIEPSRANRDTPIEALWQCVNQIGPLIPRRALNGTRL